jgi:hypothetical protein
MEKNMKNISLQAFILILPTAIEATRSWRRSGPRYYPATTCEFLNKANIPNKEITA